MKTEQTLEDVLHQLAAEEVELPEGYERIVLGLKAKKDKPDSPWYVRLFVGFSAWIAAVLLVAFLFMTHILYADVGDLFWGLMFCAIAVALNRMGPKNDFLGQLALALSLAGQVMFVVGLAFRLEEIALVALLLIILEIVLIWAYHDRFRRFVSILVIVGAVLAVLYDLDILGLVHVLIFGLATSASLLYQRKNHLLLSGVADLVQPVGYGVTVALLGMLILPLVEDLQVQQWWITAMLLVGVLLFLESRIVVDLEHGLRSEGVPWLLAGSVALAIPAARMPGILGALLVLLIGFWRTDRLLLGLAAAFLVFYLGAYYYSLEWTLLAKSVALVGTGLVLLALRCVVLRLTRGGLA